MGANPIYRFVPTQIDAPDHIKYRRILNPWFSPRGMDAAAPTIRELCKRAYRASRPDGRCDFVEEFALLFPTEAFLSVIGARSRYTEQFVAWVDDFFGGFGGDPDRRRAHGKALTKCGSSGSSARRATGEPETRRATSSSLLHATFDDGPLTTR